MSAAIDDDTIVAIATPIGRGALAMVRASGRSVRALAVGLLMPPLLNSRQATHCAVRDIHGVVLDDVIAIFYQGPASFTGEDMLEICTHGGLIVPVTVLAAAISMGAREAKPGEFSRRAVLNGKLDIVQAEAIGDLIDARNSAAHVQALRQLDGGLSRRVALLREQVLTLDAMLAYDIDFPEEDDGPVPRARMLSTALALVEALDALLATSGQGTMVNEGALVVLAGAPNVGKSALFNALLGETRAIVTEVPGTTRDAIEAVLDLPGWPVRLVDTAGLRQADDIVEQLGMEVSLRYLANAELVLACIDSATDSGHLDQLRANTQAPILVVATKRDLLEVSVPAMADVAVSARTGEGLSMLVDAIKKRLDSARGAPVLDAPVLTRARHRIAVERAREELQEFTSAWESDLLPVSVAATHVRVAAEALSELIGVVNADDVLDVVFRNFCVGK